MTLPLVVCEPHQANSHALRVHLEMLYMSRNVRREKNELSKEEMREIGYPTCQQTNCSEVWKTNLSAMDNVKGDITELPTHHSHALDTHMHENAIEIFTYKVPTITLLPTLTEFWERFVCFPYF